MDGYSYWQFICKLKNYFNGNKGSGDDKRKEVNGRIKWFNTYFSIFNNKTALQEKALPDLVRGDVVLAELGFNIDKEFGGKHYCIVLRNSKTWNDRVLVLPLTTQKPSDYEKFKDSLYLEFEDIRFLHRKIDSETGNNHKRWCYILNIRTISKSRIIYPNERNLPSEKRRLSKKYMREISNRVISQIALMPDLVDVKENYKKLKADYAELQKKYNDLVSKMGNME